MNDLLVKEICNDAIKAYKDISTPDFSFILERDAQKNYANLINDLTNEFISEDITDFNYDSCYLFEIKDTSKNAWGAAISLVGKYAYLTKRTRKNKKGNTQNLFITNFSECINESEKKLLGIFLSNNIKLLSLRELKTTLPIKLKDVDLDGGESNLVCHILFSLATHIHDL